MNIKVVTDSTCDLPQEILERCGITVLPLHINMGGRLLLDGIEVTPSDIFEHVAKGGEICGTSAANMTEFSECFQKLSQDCHAIICVTIGAEFSSCYQNACAAAADLDGPCRVYVVDSKSLSSGQGLVVLEAARLAQAGLPPDEIAARLEDARERVDASFILGRLDYMKKGGRCSSVAALGANLLQLKPCIEVKDGKMRVGKKYRGRLDKVMGQFVRDRLAPYGPGETAPEVFLPHPPTDREFLDAAGAALTADGRFSTLWDAPSGCTVACHCGPNTIGVMFLTTGNPVSEESPPK